MIRTWILALTLHTPADVHNLRVFFSGDTIHIDWTLPADPSLAGITIFRDNLDEGQTTIFEMGLTTFFDDFGADLDDDYRYWIHTRDFQGHLSHGVFVEVFTHDDDDDHDDAEWFCIVGAVEGAGFPAGLGVLAAALLLAALRRGR